MIPLPAIPWGKVLRIAPYFLLAVFFALWIHRGDVIDRQKAERKALIAEIAHKTEQARAEDLAHARTVEAAQNEVREEVSRDLETKLAAARADADRYAARLRASAGQGGGVRAHLPGTAEPAVDPAVPDPDTLVDDLRACSEAVVKAQGWQNWWQQVSEVPR